MNWQTHPVFKNETYSRMDAWRWIVKNSPEGKLTRSIRCLAKEWKWGRRKAEYFLKLLQKEEMIKISMGTVMGTPVGTVSLTLTNCNISLNHALEKTMGTPVGTVMGTPKEVKNKEEKDTKKISRKLSLTEWEKIHGELTVEKLKPWIEKKGYVPAKISPLLDRFRESCVAKGYQYLDFKAAFRSWSFDWESCKGAVQRDNMEKYNV